MQKIRAYHNGCFWNNYTKLKVNVEEYIFGLSAVIFFAEKYVVLEYNRLTLISGFSFLLISILMHIYKSISNYIYISGIRCILCVWLEYRTTFRYSTSHVRQARLSSGSSFSGLPTRQSIEPAPQTKRSYHKIGNVMTPWSRPCHDFLPIELLRQTCEWF